MNILSVDDHSMCRRCCSRGERGVRAAVDPHRQIDAEQIEKARGAARA